MSGISCLFSVVHFWEASSWADGLLQRRIERAQGDQFPYFTAPSGDMIAGKYLVD
jgi:hypothetical protein